MLLDISTANHIQHHHKKHLQMINLVLQFNEINKIKVHVIQI